jgi:hypothetical protein
MTNINDKRNFLKQELLRNADQISALRSKAAIDDKEALNQMSALASELQKNSSALMHLLDVEAEKVIEKIVVKEVVEVPVPQVEKVVVPVATPQDAPKISVSPIPPPPSPGPTGKSFPDLKTLIGLNEKLMLIKNLFGGDSSAFDAAIGKLNSCSSRAESDAAFSSMISERGWKMESEAVLALQSILKRRTA